MRRRDFFSLTAGAAVADWPQFASAQQQPVIGYLSPRGKNEDTFTEDAFREGLAELGFVPSRNVTIEYRRTGGQYDRLVAEAADLVRRQVSAIVAAGTASGRIAKAATSTIPVVFVTADDPVDNALVASLNRPGGNVTGASMVSAELRPKMLQMLTELVPQAKLVHVLANPNNASFEIQTREIRTAAGAIGLQLELHMAPTASDIDAIFAKFPQRKDGALLVASDPFLTSRRSQIAELAVRHGMPGVYPWREYVQAGGLMSYGSKPTEGYRLAGMTTGRILKGEKPADLPVQQPTRFELVINLKTAKALGLTIPPALIARADELIE